VALYVQGIESFDGDVAEMVLGFLTCDGMVVGFMFKSGVVCIGFVPPTEGGVYTFATNATMNMPIAIMPKVVRFLPWKNRERNFLTCSFSQRYALRFMPTRTPHGCFP
tara:strand:+ start:2197 stop:2520 length:324 start_codon:yes stop_codon:yes gene_type:complete